MSRDQWYSRPVPRFLSAVVVAALALVLVNPFMSNDRIFGHAPWSIIAPVLPALAALAFLHFATPYEQRSSLLRYGLRVLAVSAFAYATAAVILVILVLVVTGELI